MSAADHDGWVVMMHDDEPMFRDQDGHGWVPLATHEERLAEIEQLRQWAEAMEACDCYPSEMSSRMCPKCGRRGAETAETMASILSRLNAAEHELAAKDAEIEWLREAWEEADRRIHALAVRASDDVSLGAGQAFGIILAIGARLGIASASGRDAPAAAQQPPG